MQKYTARNLFSCVLGYTFSKIFCHLSKGPKFCRKFGLQRGKGLKVSEAHPYPPLYRTSSPGIKDVLKVSTENTSGIKRRTSHLYLNLLN